MSAQAFHFLETDTTASPALGASPSCEQMLGRPREVKEQGHEWAVFWDKQNGVS